MQHLWTNGASISRADAEMRSRWAREHDVFQVLLTLPVEPRATAQQQRAGHPEEHKPNENQWITFIAVKAQTKETEKEIVEVIDKTPHWSCRMTDKKIQTLLYSVNEAETSEWCQERRRGRCVGTGNLKSEAVRAASR